MMRPTGIAYGTCKWNPTTGCSNGCPRCWARAAARRQPAYFGGDFAPRQWPERPDEPLRTRKPQVVLVSFMGDLFDESISDVFRTLVFSIMHYCPQDLFLVLTKQAERMRDYVCKFGEVENNLYGGSGDDPSIRRWPFENVWLGVTVTGPDDDWRIKELVATPAAYRWVSLEPLVAEVDPGMIPSACLIDWWAIGAESGPGRRPAPAAWFDLLRKRFRTAGIRHYVKQQAEHTDGSGEVLHFPPTAETVPWFDLLRPRKRQGEG